MNIQHNRVFLCMIMALINSVCVANNQSSTTTTDVTEFSFSKKRPEAETTPSLETHLTAAPPTEERIYLNFDNASLSSVLNYLIERKNLDVIPHKDLAAIKVTLLSREPMSLEEAWETVLILMEANNFTIINVNGINRVVPLNANQQNALPCYSSARGTEPEDLPNTNATIRYIYFCKNIKVGAAQAILTPLLNDRAIQVNNALQAFVLTDNGNNIKAAMRIVKELDIGGIRQAIKIMELKYVDAEQLAKLFNEQIIQGQQQQQDMKIRIISEENKREMSYFAKDTKILTDPTRNRLIFMGASDSIDKIILFIKTYLDVPLEAAKSRLHVKELRYYTAENMKALVETMISPPKGQGSANGTVEGEYKFFTDVIISAEQASTGTEQGRGSGNRLIISCNTDDWSRLERFIDDLDKPQPQVALEMLIVDVQTTDTKALGGQFRTKSGLLGDKITAAAFPLKTTATALTTEPTNLINTIQVDPNSSILSFGNATSSEVWGIIRAVYGINHTNIIQQPYLVINNNAKGTEAFTVTRRVAGALNTSGSVPVKSFDNVNANVSVEITPHVNAAGIIKLDIAVSVDEFKEASGSTPDMTQRAIKSQASMAAGEVLVLGGLTNSKHSSQRWAVPLLSSIPIIGNLFKDQVRATTKSNLYIFIRPTVIKPHFGLGADEYTQLKLDYAKYQILSYDNISLSKDPIQRHFFAPGRYSSKRKQEDLAHNRMPIIDDFAERRNMPNEVEMTKDPYFHRVQEAATIEYDPEEGFASMPHINPHEYLTPGLLDELNADTFWDSLEDEYQPSLQQRKSSLR